MSGTIQELPLRTCPRCGALYMEDENMYEDADRCPGCGKDLDVTGEKSGDEVDI